MRCIRLHPFPAFRFRAVCVSAHGAAVHCAHHNQEQQHSGRPGNAPPLCQSGEQRLLVLAPLSAPPCLSACACHLCLCSCACHTLSHSASASLCQVPEYCRSLTERDVSAHAFELIFAFDEIIALGYRFVGVQQCTSSVLALCVCVPLPFPWDWRLQQKMTSSCIAWLFPLPLFFLTAEKTSTCTASAHTLRWNRTTNKSSRCAKRYCLLIHAFSFILWPPPL